MSADVEVRVNSRGIFVRTAWTLTVLAALIDPRTVAASEVEYTAEIEGVEGELHNKLMLVSKAVSLVDRPPSTRAGLTRRVAGDIERFDAVLRSEGFFAATVEQSVKDGDDDQVEVRFDISAGRPYVLGRYHIRLEDGRRESAADLLRRFQVPMSPGSRGRASEIVAAEASFVGYLREHGFPFASLVNRKVEVDHETRLVNVDLEVSPGPLAHFGPLSLEGLVGVEENYVRRRQTWKMGDVYDANLVAEYRKDLMETGLFSTVNVEHGEVPDRAGALAIKVIVAESKVRSIGAGVGYSSSLGAGGNIFWEHRNFLHSGERLRLSAELSEQGATGAVVYREPDFLMPNQAFVFDTAYELEDTDAFRSEKFVSSVGVERSIGEKTSIRGGLVVEYGPVESEAAELIDDQTVRQDETFRLVGVPFALRFDGANDLLDPTLGTRIELTLTPYVQSLGSDLSFLVGRVSDTVYFPFDRKRRVVFAGRAVFGWISGISFGDVPADKRFYAGGGGSIRGYDYQLVGDLDAVNKPIGGRSLLEFNGELRWRLNDQFGLVPFVDGGTVYRDSIPDLDLGLNWGAGLGFRYFSPVGPVRLDIATPINPRSSIDEPVQLYISLGQAF